MKSEELGGREEGGSERGGREKRGGVVVVCVWGKESIWEGREEKRSPTIGFQQRPIVFVPILEVRDLRFDLMNVVVQFSMGCKFNHLVLPEFECRQIFHLHASILPQPFYCPLY